VRFESSKELKRTLFSNQSNLGAYYASPTGKQSTQSLHALKHNLNFNPLSFKSILQHAS
jgi:hypothetical protein